MTAANAAQPIDGRAALELLKDRINLSAVPMSERGSRLMLFRTGDHFAVRLAERWFKLDNQLSSYRRRRPIISEWTLSDETLAVQPMEQETWPHKVRVRTPQGAWTLLFVDTETLLLTLPAGRVGVSFVTSQDSAALDRRGGVLRREGDIRRNIAYTTNARLLRNEVGMLADNSLRVQMVMETTSGGVLLVNITPRLGFNRSLPDAATAEEASAERWAAWFAKAPAVLPERLTDYLYAWWVMRAGLISTRYYTTREAMTPSKIHYVGVWQWDAYFHALAYRHVEMGLAKDQLRVVLDHQRADGMIPDAVHDEGIVTHLTFPVDADVTKPPLLAWTAWKLYEQSGDRDFLDEIYDGVLRSNRWWFEQNDQDGNGLCEYAHPFSSGLDDSPLWDDGVPVESPDLNTYLVLQMEALSRMAAVIGEDPEPWAARADTLTRRMIETLWDEETGCFRARRNGALVDVLTPFSFFPMLTGRLPAPLCERMVALLTDPRHFWSRYPVPTVALDDPHYDPLQMWRGPTWLNVNYLLIEGLNRCGYAEVAKELRHRTLELVAQSDDIYEYYHPETGEVPPKAAPIFGWSAALYIELAIQEANETLTTI